MISVFVFPHITNSNYRDFKTFKNFSFIKVDNFKCTSQQPMFLNKFD